MKKIFTSKFNIFLIILLSLSIVALGYFSIKLLFVEEPIIVPDFSNSNISEVMKWCNEVGETNPCIIEREYSDVVEKDKVIYQSISASDELDSKISFVISLGQKVEIDSLVFDKNTNRKTVEQWVKDNSLTNVTYIEEESTEVEKGNVISIQPEKIINNDTEIKVYISSGTKSDENEDIIINSGKYLNISEDEFIKAVKKIGLVPKHADQKDEKSSNIDESNIVWHGSGTYYSGEEIRYGLSLGKNDEIIVNSGDYKGLTLEEFKKKVEALGLVPVHNTTKEDEYSDTIKENSILWHGSGRYVKGENITYTLSKGSVSGEIIVNSGDYIGLSLEEFKKKVEALGLVAKHNSSKSDDYSNTIEENCILWHGSGTYVKSETITYTLSKGVSDSTVIHIEAGDYIGKTYSEFETLVKKLGLVPTHSTKWDDDYSDTIAKGSIDWHGSGDYVKGENINYTLSLGKKEEEVVKKVNVTSYTNKLESEFKTFLSNNGLTGNKSEAYSDTINAGYIISNYVGEISTNQKVDYTVSIGKDERVSVADYSGKSVSELETFLTNNGLSANKSEEYSSIYEQGIVISNDTGLKDKGATISYKVSKGVKKANIMAKTYYSPYKKSTFLETKNNLSSNAFSSFTNVTYTGIVSEYTSGVIIDIKVNNDSDYTPGDYPLDTTIEVIISTGN